MRRNDILIYLLYHVKFEIATFGDNVGFVNYSDDTSYPSLILYRTYLKLDEEKYFYDDLIGIRYNSENGELTISLKQKTVIYKNLNL